jgi:hypothetical protein
VVEGASLENWNTGNRIGGSNPSLSAIPSFEARLITTSKNIHAGKCPRQPWVARRSEFERPKAKSIKVARSGLSAELWRCHDYFPGRPSISERPTRFLEGLTSSGLWLGVVLGLTTRGSNFQIAGELRRL